MATLDRKIGRETIAPVANHRNCGDSARLLSATVRPHREKWKKCTVTVMLIFAKSITVSLSSQQGEGSFYLTRSYNRDLTKDQFSDSLSRIDFVIRFLKEDSDILRLARL